MSTIQIHQFPTIPQAPADADVLAIEVNGITYKVSKAVLAAAIAANISPEDIGAYSKTQTYAKTETYSKTETDNAIQQSTAKGDTAFDAITRSDATDITTFADTVEAGKMQFFRNRTGVPTSSWNYSPGIVLRPTSSETVVVLFGLRVDSIAMLRKDGGTWASNWTIIS